MPALADKSLIVSLHDAHPGSRAAIAEQVRFLAGYGVTRTSILVVPEFHHEGSVAADKPFCEAVSAWQAAGHEIVLHGLFSRPAGVAARDVGHAFLDAALYQS